MHGRWWTNRLNAQPGLSICAPSRHLVLYVRGKCWCALSDISLRRWLIKMRLVQNRDSLCGLVVEVDGQPSSYHRGSGLNGRSGSVGQSLLSTCQA